MDYDFIFDKEKNKKRFKLLRLSFWGHLAFIPLLLASDVLRAIDVGLLQVLGTLLLANYVFYLYMLGTLVAEAGKNVFYWTFWTMAFPIFGQIASYLNMKIVASQNQWD